MAQPSVKPLRREASDNTPEALAAAAENFKQVIDDWCRCEGETYDPSHDEVYFRSPVTGSHGWMCVKCLKITQTG